MTLAVVLVQVRGYEKDNKVSMGCDRKNGMGQAVVYLAASLFDTGFSEL